MLSVLRFTRGNWIGISLPTNLNIFPKWWDILDFLSGNFSSSIWIREKKGENNGICPPRAVRYLHRNPASAVLALSILFSLLLDP
jgi:hypothetical protein